jgi:ribosomal protein S18 acetylase RimI-like enzyme
MGVIRAAIIEDLGSVCRLISDVVDHLRSQGIDQWDEFYPTRNIFQDDIARGTLLIYSENGSAAGIVTLDDQQPPEYRSVQWTIPGRSLVIHRLAVNPAHQGRGIARSLMRHAEKTAARRLFDAIRLDAFEGNPAAVRLYDSLGYRRAGFVSFRKGRFHCFEKLVTARLPE